MTLTGRRLRTPRAAAVAGIAFALLLGTAYTLIRLSIPLDPGESEWFAENAGTVRVALGLIPFAGLAFLWFMGVVRDRIGDYEDRFFSTVFFGSGLLFLAMVFVSAATAGSLLVAGVPLRRRIGSPIMDNRLLTGVDRWSLFPIRVLAEDLPAANHQEVATVDLEPASVGHGAGEGPLRHPVVGSDVVVAPIAPVRVRHGFENLGKRLPHLNLALVPLPADLIAS